MRMRLPLSLGLLAATAALCFGLWGCDLVKIITGPTTAVGGGQQNNGGQTPGGTGACGLTPTQQSVTTPNGTTIGGNGTLTVGFQAAAGVIDIPNTPCLNGVTVTWTATGTPSGACALVGQQGSTSQQVQESATGTCSVSASAFAGISPGTATLTLK